MKSRKEYRGLGGIVSPIYIAQRFQAEGFLYFEPKDLVAWFSITSRQAYQLCARLESDKLATAVEKGKYLLTGLEPERILSNPLFIAAQLVTPSYVSYWSALHHYGFTTQAPQTVFCVTTKKKRPVSFNGQTYRYVTVRPRKFFGYRLEQVGGLSVLIADECKAILDGLDQMRYSGGLPEVAQSLQMALPDLNLALLTDYAARMGDQSLGSRLGYLLERLGHKITDLPISSSPVALDPALPRRGLLDLHWHIVVNVKDTELFPQGIA